MSDPIINGFCNKSNRRTMTSVVGSLVVFGQVFLISLAPNIPPVKIPGANTTLIPNIDLKLPEVGLLLRRNDYTYSPGIGAHKVHTQAANWNTARKTCEEEGGYLAIINSVAESEHIGQLAEKSKPHNGSEDSDYVHIGFHNLYNDDDFVTIHGESLVEAGFNEWESGEPSKTGENCGSIYSSSGKLNDISCANSHGFICELSYV